MFLLIMAYSHIANQDALFHAESLFSPSLQSLFQWLSRFICLIFHPAFPVSHLTLNHIRNTGSLLINAMTFLEFFTLKNFAAILAFILYAFPKYFHHAPLIRLFSVGIDIPSSSANSFLVINPRFILTIPDSSKSLDTFFFFLPL